MEKPRDTGKQKVRSAEVGTDILKALAELSPATSLSRLAEQIGRASCRERV